jgi:hypothetical protein
MANAARAYILIECTVGRTKEVVTGLGRLKGMKSVETVTGPYDVIAIVELATLNEIGDLVTQHSSHHRYYQNGNLFSSLSAH